MFPVVQSGQRVTFGSDRTTKLSDYSHTSHSFSTEMQPNSEFSQPRHPHALELFSLIINQHSCKKQNKTKKHLWLVHRAGIIHGNTQ